MLVQYLGSSNAWNLHCWPSLCILTLKQVSFRKATKMSWISFGWLGVTLKAAAFVLCCILVIVTCSAVHKGTLCRHTMLSSSMTPSVSAAFQNRQSRLALVQLNCFKSFVSSILDVALHCWEGQWSSMTKLTIARAAYKYVRAVFCYAFVKVIVHATSFCLPHKTL